jgi:hypothetical protein
VPRPVTRIGNSSGRYAEAGRIASVTVPAIPRKIDG